MELSKAYWPGWQAVRSLGGGASGTVFEIQHYAPGGGVESAALKVVAIPSDDGQIQAMYQRGMTPEAVGQMYRARMESAHAAWAAVQNAGEHPNVVPVQDLLVQGHADGIGWDIRVKMPMRTSARELYPQGAAQEQVIRLGVDVSNALVHCHGLDLLHEGLKLSNIFLSPEGNYQLSDFGAAKATGMPCSGDLTCMAPEIYWGMGYDSRADVYALGVVLYTLLNDGCLPGVLPGASEQEITDACTRRLSGEAVLPPRNGSPALQQVVLKACAYEPIQRYADASQLRDALLALAEPCGTREQEAQPHVPMPDIAQSQTYRPDTQQSHSYQPQQPWQQDVPEAELAEPEEKRPKPRPAAKKNRNVLILLLAVAAALVALAVVVFFTVHIWTEPSCNEVKQCRLCGKTAGRAAGHQWQAASCAQPETCSVCGEEKGEALGHQWSPATRTAPQTCSVCHATQGDVLGPQVWTLGLISTGWNGGYSYEADGKCATLAFPEDPDFAQSEVSVTNASGYIVVGGFEVQWEDGTAVILPKEELELGVYQVQFQQGEDNGAVLTLCYGYEDETYLCTTERFWNDSTWRSRAYGRYLTVSGSAVATTENAGQAAVFGSEWEMFAVEIDESGNATLTADKTVPFQTMTYVCGSENDLTVFVYREWYLACDSQGTVYLTKELSDECFWLTGR